MLQVDTLHQSKKTKGKSKGKTNDPQRSHVGPAEKRVDNGMGNFTKVLARPRSALGAWRECFKEAQC